MKKMQLIYKCCSFDTPENIATGRNWISFDSRYLQKKKKDYSIEPAASLLAICFSVFICEVITHQLLRRMNG